MEQNNKIIETYAEDMVKVIQDDNTGLIKKIIHENEKHEIEKKNFSPQSIKNEFFMVIGLLFFTLGVGTLFYFIQKQNVPTVQIAAQFIPLIFNDRSNFIEVKDFKKEAIAQTVLNEAGRAEVKHGGVEGIYLTEDKNVIGLRRFITLIESAFTLEHDSQLVDDHFMMGVVHGETKDFFIIIKMRSLVDGFDSMRAWEAKMFTDLHGFFGVDLTAGTQYLATTPFKDGIVENKNARVLYDSNNKIVLMYILVDDNSIVITDSVSAAHEVMFRLAASRVNK